MALQPCRVCKAMIASAAPVCPQCGIRRTAIPTTSQVQYVPPGAGSVYSQPPPYTQPQPSLRVSYAGADSCPRCFGQVHSNHFTFAHLLIAVCLFPLGLLVFLAPIKRCPCGHEYGVGRFIVSVCVWLAVATAILIALLVAAYLSQSSANRSASVVGRPTPIILE